MPSSTACIAPILHIIDLHASNYASDELYLDQRYYDGNRRWREGAAVTCRSRNIQGVRSSVLLVKGLELAVAQVEDQGIVDAGLLILVRTGHSPI